MAKTIVFVGIITAVYVVVAWLLLQYLLPKSDASGIAAVSGAIVGGLGAFAVSAVTAVVALAGQRQAARQQLHDRAAADAMELTRMDYSIRQTSLKQPQTFLAPVKVYRELYKALVQLFEHGTWPKEIENLGLLNVFELRPENKSQNEQ